MKIVGNTTCTTMPRTNWAETDPNAASFLENKPDSLKNPKALVFTGAASATYDGSEQVVVNIPTGGGGGEGGADGASAYEIAIANGFEGTEAEWLASLQGKTAYQYALDGGYTGTEEDFEFKLAAEYRPATWTPTAEDVGARPSTWTPTAEEVGAAATSHNHDASNIMSGTLSVARGGTGKSTHTANAVLTGNGTSAVKNVAVASGAFFSTGTSAAPKFGTLPIAQGGTGSTSAANARKALGTNMTLLWTNGSPTSTFAAQSVSISGGDYDCYGVVPHASINTTATTFLPMTICYKGKEGHLIGLPNNKTARRVFSVNSAGTSVTFEATEYCKSTYGTSVTENDYIIPMYIFGMFITTP